MLRVKTRLGLSRIDGIGLFADQFIPRDTIVWEFNPLIDLKLRDDDISSLAEGARQQVQKYSYRDELTGLYIFCGDDARFFNHSDEPNCVDVTWGPFGGRTIAGDDIRQGDELTCNYASFDQDFMTGRYRLPERQYGRSTVPVVQVLPQLASRR